jgi:hypothetical protein
MAEAWAEDDALGRMLGELNMSLGTARDHVANTLANDGARDYPALVALLEALAVEIEASAGPIRRATGLLEG